MSVVINPLTGFQSQRFGVALGPLKASSDISFGGYTLVAKYRARILRTTGNSVRLTLGGLVAAGHTGTLSNVTISLVSKATGAKPYDSGAAPTAITFGGSASVALSFGSEHVSDIVTFGIDGTRGILIAFNVAASSHVSLMSGLSNEHIMYSRPATTEAAIASRTAGYTASSGISPILHKLECFS